MQIKCRWWILFFLLCWALPLFGVGSTGTIVGTVTDPTGAVIAKAKVTVRNQETHAVRESETDGDGDFTLPMLPPGHYQVTVEAPGFRRGVYSRVRVEVDQSVRLDVALQIGAISEEVIVTESVPVIEADTSTLGQVIDQQKVQQLPLNERNFLTFTLLVPGAQLPSEGSQNSTQGGAISVNGAREQANNFLLDGVDNNDSYINQYSALPAIDAIQEFKVQSSNSTAEFGRSGGAQINVVLKSGTNQLHGSLFEFIRNRQLDAKNFFDLPDCTSTSVPGTCASIPRFDRNQFGGSLGGPVRGDKTFFFVSYEGLRLRQATTREATIPSQLQRAIALAVVPPGTGNPAGEAVFNLLPAANVGPDLFNSNTFVAAPIIRRREDLLTVKLDHHADSVDTLSGHYSLSNQRTFNPYDPLNSFTNLPGFGTFQLARGQNAGFTWTRILSPQLINEFRLGFNRLRVGNLQEHHGVNKNQELGFPTVLTNPVDLGFPNVTLSGFDGVGEPLIYPQSRHDTTLHFVDNVAWHPGAAHELKFGADIRLIQLTSFLDFLARGDWFFQGFGTGDPQLALIQLLLGAPDFALAVNGTTDHQLRTAAVNFYLQDDIHVRPRFTLNVGLRYEYNRPPVEHRNRFSVPDLSPNSLTCTPQPDCQFIRAGTGGVPRATYRGDFNNLAPRIGFAWRPLKTERFVVRAAYSIFYDLGILNKNIFPRFNPPFFEVVFFPNTGTNTIQDIFTTTGVAVPQAQMIDRNFRDAYMQHWNLDLQYEVEANWVVDAAYVGSKGTHLEGVRDLNQVRPDTGLSPFPQFTSILDIESRASSSYNAFQFRSEKRLSQGLTFLAAYTWSKSIDDVSAVFGTGVDSGLPQDSRNLKAERVLSDFHTKHRFVLSYLYELPWGNGRRWLNRPGVLKRVLGDWQLGGIWSFQSGHPFTVTLGATRAQSAFAAFGVSDRPDLIADPFRPGPVPNNPDPLCQLTLSQGGRAADRVRVPQSWFNACAFAAPPPGRFGTAGRDIVIGPGLKNIDFTLLKDILLRGENHRIQFRLDAFNLLNHPNLDIPNRALDAPTFTQVQSANAFGNKPPRQMQFSLRYVF